MKAMPVIAAGVLSVSAMPAFAADAAAGEQVFSGNCAACHAGGQNVIMPEKTLQVRCHSAHVGTGLTFGCAGERKAPLTTTTPDSPLLPPL